MEKPEMPLISVALCTYNGEKYLADQLDSILAQTYPNVEIVVCDDRSTDSTVEILKRYAAQNPNIRVYINDLNIGLTKNFERAASLTTGPLVAFSDQDDIWMPRKLEILERNMGDNVLTYCDSEYIDSQGRPLGKRISDFRNLVSGRDLLIWDQQSGVWLAGHTALFRRAVLDAATPFSEFYSHDGWIGYNAMLLGTIKYVPEVLVQYRQHGANAVGGLGCHGLMTSPRAEMTPRQKHEESLRKIEVMLRQLEGFKGAEYAEYESFLLRMHRYSSDPTTLNRLRRAALRLRHLNRLYAPRKRNVFRKAYTVFKNF